MQVKRFDSGGFVIHKIRIPESKLRFSAWYDASGQLLDVEAFTSSGKPFAPFTISRAKSGPVGLELAILGFRQSGLLQWARGGGV
ncbi:MAG: hypothetical protein INH13_25740 [Cupriavidus sp.]|nr:hypothetical protein [Cupriavidus sp.]